MPQSRLTPEQQAQIRAIAQGASPRQQQPQGGQFFRDTARQLGVGTSMIPEMLAGVGDTAAGLAGYDRPFARRTSALAEATGMSPKAWGEGVREQYSPALQQQQESYEQFWDAASQQWQRGRPLRAAGAVAAGIALNPRAMSSMVFESIPASVLGGAAFGRLARAAVPSMTPMTAGGVGQMPIFAGFTMSQVDEEVDPQRAALAALGVGIGAGGIAIGGAHLSYRLGFIDPHTAMAGGLTGAVAPGTPQRSFAPRVLGGAVAEGLLQDMPQEALEQMGKNWAEDKPLFQDVPRRSIDGLIAGMGMGAMFNVMRPPVAPETDTPPSQPVPTDLTQPRTPTTDGPEPGGPVVEQMDAAAKSELLQQYQRVSVLETQLGERHADYRELASRERQRLEALLIEQGETVESLQLTQAQMTYQDLARRVDFAEQQGRDTTIKRQRMALLEEQFGIDALTQPEQWIVEKIRARPDSESLFRQDGRLTARAVAEYRRLMDMHGDRMGQYVTAKLETMQADEALMRPREPLAPLYEALGEVLQVEIPPIPQALPAPTRPETHTPFRESAIGQADMAQQTRVAEARQIVQALDEAMRQREEQQRLDEIRRDTEEVLARTEPTGAMAEALRPLQEQMRRQAEFEQAQQQREMQEAVRRELEVAEAYRQRELQDAAQPAPVAAPAPAPVTPAAEPVAAPVTPAAEPAREPTPRGPDRRARPRPGADRRVADMTLEQAREALLTDTELTGIPNRLAYEEAAKLPVQISIDADSLKWVNDVMGHQYGDEMITAIAHALHDETPNAYRFGGDEFVVQAESMQEALRLMQEVRDRLSQAVLTFETPDGTIITKTGIEVSYGAGETLALAEQALKRDKAARAGQRVQRDAEGRPIGDPVGVSRTTPEGQQTGERAATTEAVAEPIEVIRPKRPPGPTEGGKARYQHRKDAQAQATRRAGNDLLHDYTVAQEGLGFVVHKTPKAPEPVAAEPAPAPETTTEAVPDAVQEPSPAEVPAQPEAEARTEVGEQVPTQEEVAQASQEVVDRPWQEVIENLQLDPNTDTVSEALNSAVNFLDRQESVYSELVAGLQEAFESSEATDAFAALRGIMDVAYETEGALPASPQEIGGLRRALTAAQNYAPDVFRRALEDAVVQAEKIPVARKDSPTRFYEDIVKAGIVDAGAGKYTNVPKKGDQYARAREIAREKGKPVGFKETSTAEVSRIRDVEARSEAVSAIAEMRAPKAPGRFNIAENGTELTTPMPVGRIRAAVNVFKNRLRGATPTIHVFANQADMQAKNPDLYQRAVAARETGDFADANAAGYTFGDGQIAIFSDRIFTQKQLSFVLAHETLGHFGMRALFGNVQFNNLMDKVWHESANNIEFRNAVDTAMESRKDMTRQEAVEEVLADQAAIIDSSILLRVWEALKRVLERLTPIEFSDQTARYMIYHSRRYVRNRGVRIMTDADGRFMITGPQSQMSKWREYNLNRAKRLKERGVPMQEIERKTGWFEGDDGMWRFEISDRDARIIPSQPLKALKEVTSFYDTEHIKQNSIPLKDFLKHNKLYAAYNAAENINIAQASNELLNGSDALFVTDSNLILINSNYLTAERGFLASLVLHEAQHWIQAHEGFEAGIGASIAKDLMFSLPLNDLTRLASMLALEAKHFHTNYVILRDIINSINEKPSDNLKKLRRLSDLMNPEARNLTPDQLKVAKQELVTKVVEETVGGISSDSVPNTIRLKFTDALMDDARKYALNDFLRVQYNALPSHELIDRMNKGDKDSIYRYLHRHVEQYMEHVYYELYRKGYGEAEARAVEIRRAWTKHMRKQKPFRETMKEMLPDGMFSQNFILNMNGRDMAGRLRIMNNVDFEANGHEVSMDQITNDMQQIESMQDPGMAGRFYQNNSSLGHIHHVIGQDLSIRGYDGTDVNRWMNKVKDTGQSVTEFMTRAIREIRTMNYNARDNRGYRAFFRIMSATVNHAISLRTKYNNMMPIIMNPSLEIGGKKMTDGITRAELQRAGQMAIDSTLYFFETLPDKDVIRGPKGAKPLVVLKKDPYGGMKVAGNWDAIEKMMAESRITPEQFQKGFSYPVREVQPLSPQQRARLEAEQKKQKDIMASLKGKERSQEYIDARNRNREITADLESGSQMVEVQREVAPRPEITKDSIEYRAYLEVQRVEAEKAIDLLAANYEAAAGERVNVEEIISDAIGHDLTARDKRFLRAIEDNFVALREQGMEYDSSGTVVYSVDSMRKASEFMVAFNQALLSKEGYFLKQDAPKVKEFLVNLPYDDFVTEMQEFRKHTGTIRASSENSVRFLIQHRIQDLAFFEMKKNDAELHAKRTIMGNWVPLGREGRFQVRIQAVDMNGKEVAISQRQRSQLIYMQLNNRGEAQRTAEEITKMMEESSENGDGVFQTEVIKDGARIIQPVKLVARTEVARTKPSIHTEVNLNEVLSTLSQFNIQLTPQERAAITVGLTAQNAKARSRLHREGTPGYDVKNWQKYVSQDLETAASVIARRKHRHLLDQVLDTTHSKTAELWYGSQKKYNELKERYERLSNDPNVGQNAVDAAKREFMDYHYTFVIKDSQHEGNRYLDRAQMDLSFLEEQTSVEYTDFASGDTASRIRMATTFAQLGGSAATALLNILALGTNVMPFLSSYNQKNNFGGGFGVANAVSEMFRVGKIAAPGERAFAPFYNKLLEGYNFDNPESTAPEHIAAQKRLAAEKLTPDEAVFLRDQIQAGVMQAALFNAMLGSARGRLTTGFKQRAAQGWMYMFSHSEQAARRVTGLAAYRLARNRALKSGKEFNTAIAEAKDFAINAINDTVGEYAMFNRPSLFRGGFQQFIFMYKMFPLTSVLLFSQMDKKGKLLMLGMLMFLSGAKGAPLGDDMMDVIDTIAQRLGLGPRGAWKGSAEKTLIDFVESMVGPELTPWVMRGFVNNMMPVNLSDRTSLSNLVPGTGIGLYGANVGREALEVAGPFASFLADSAGTAGRIAEWGAGKAGIRPETTTFLDVVRQSPFTMFRAAGDSVAYLDSGAVVNQRGQVVTEDMHWGTIMGRMLGFYPSAAVREYDVIRTMSRLDNFQKQIVALHRQRWLAAKLVNDHALAREIEQQVREWNEHARGTEFEIRNFIPNSYRALRTARMSATERYRQSSAIAQRQHIDRMAELLGATD